MKSSDVLNSHGARFRLSLRPRIMIEHLEARVLLSGDFPFEAVIALARGGSIPTANSGIFKSYRQTHGPKVHLNQEVIDEAQEEDDAPPTPLDPGAEPGPDAPAVSGTIEAANFDTNPPLNGNLLFIPPDPSGAVGPNNVVNVVNAAIQFFTKSGTAQNTQSLASFFASQSPANSLFDPKVIYDQYNGRFVVEADEQVDAGATSSSSTSRVLIAVSDDSDPNGTWFETAINTKLTISSTTRWLDYPGLAIDANAIYLTGNMFGFSGGGFGGSRLWIISKAGLYTGGSPSSVSLYDPSTLSGAISLFTLQPAQMFGTAPAGVGTFLMAADIIDGSHNDYLSVIKVTNPLSSPTFTNTYISLGNTHNDAVAIPTAPQAGTATNIATNDDRLINVVWRNNNLYAANTTNPPSGSQAGQATARWYRISADGSSTPTLADTGVVTGDDIAPSTYTFFPSVNVDSAGNMAINFAASASTIHPGAYYTGRLATDAAGTVQTPTQTLAAGLDFYVRKFSGASNRWGDYTSVALDPTDNRTFWLYNEYAILRGSVTNVTQDGRWGTRWGNFAFPLPVSATPGTPDLLAASDTGNSPTDNLTKLDNSTAGSTLQFSVTGTVIGATVTIYSDGTAIGSALAAGTSTTVTTNGSFDLVDGTHSITAKQTEVGKSQSAASSALSIMVDTVAPTITASSFQFEVAPQQLIYTFSEDVSATLSASDIAVASVPPGTNPALSAPSWNAGTKTATFDFSSSPVPDNNYTATLTGTGVTDAAGNSIAGTPQLAFFFLAGDGNRNKTVEITDFNILAANFGKSGQTFSQGNYDYSADGVVSITDFNVLAANFGHSLP